MTFGTELMVMTPDGKRLVTAGLGCMDIWQLDALGVWQLIGKGILADELDSVTCLAITDNGKRFVSSSTDGIIRVWQQEETNNWRSPIVRLFPDNKKLIKKVEITKNGKRVIASCNGTVAQTWAEDEQGKWHALGALLDYGDHEATIAQGQFFPAFYGDFYS